MRFEILRMLHAEARMNPRLLGGLTVFSALATVVIIGTVSAAAQLATSGDPGLRLAGMFLIATVLYAFAQTRLMGGFAVEVEGIIDRIRCALFDGIRHADLATLKAVGRAPLVAAITRDTQTISRNLPLLVIGTQQLVLVVLICAYLATLSMTACVLAALFSVVSVSVHLSRMKQLGDATAAVERDEGRMFEGLGGLLHGLKEVRLSRARGDALLAELAGWSEEARQRKGALKAHWGREFALIQLAFYCLLGVMVFVVPSLTADFHEVALPGTMAALFLIGPIGTVATAIPAIDEAERALRAIRETMARLRGAQAVEDSSAPEGAPGVEGAQQTAESAAEPARKTAVLPDSVLPGPIETVELNALCYRYPGQNGERGFAVGPLDAQFRRGQLTFVTGGNGSGKSTFMQLLTGLVGAHSGTLRVDGQPIDAALMPAWRDCIAAVFADFHLFARLYGIPAARLGEADRLLRWLEMQHKVSLVGSAFSSVELSAGQRKRLALVSALLEDKPVLILDEWAADQDPHFRAVFYEQILPALRAENRIVICVTHDDRWFGMADQILHMNEGRIETVRAAAAHPAG